MSRLAKVRFFCEFFICGV